MECFGASNIEIVFSLGPEPIHGAHQGAMGHREQHQLLDVCNASTRGDAGHGEMEDRSLADFSGL